MSSPVAAAGSVQAGLLSGQQLRQLKLFAIAVAFGEACFFTVLAPMLPSLAEELGISRTGAGVLAAAYPAGIAMAMVPAGLAAVTLGPRRTARLGMAMVALSSLGFAFGDSAAALVIARFAQGTGSAVAWAGALAWLAHRGPAERRGSLMGATIGASFVGTVIAPILALLTEHSTRVAVFVPVAVALGAVAAWGGPRDEVGPELHPGARRPFAMFRHSAIVGVLSVMLLAGVFLGLLMTLGPLLLSARGVDDGKVALVFLAVYAAQAAITPALGRVVDRDGPTRIVAAALLISALLLPLIPIATDAPSTAILVVILTTLALGTVLPVAVWLSDLADALGEQQGLAMAFFNGAWGLGFALGALASTSAADNLGLSVPFIVTAVLCAVGAWWCLSSRRADLKTPATSTGAP